MSASLDHRMTEAATTEALREAFAQSRRSQQPFGGWIRGVLMGVMALLGLFFLSRAEDAGITILGLILFGLGLANIFRLIHVATASPTSNQAS